MPSIEFKINRDWGGDAHAAWGRSAPRAVSWWGAGRAGAAPGCLSATTAGKSQEASAYQAQEHTDCRANRWRTYQPPGGARYSSSSGWRLRRRPLRFHLRPKGYSTPCVLGPCRRARWTPLTCCFQRSTGVRVSSSWKIRRARWCSHVGCSIYVISNQGAAC
jgi:hypothetical protein